MCSSTLKKSCCDVHVSLEHRNSDHYCVVSRWEYKIEAKEEHKPNILKFSVSRSLKFKCALKAYTRTANKFCRNLQKDNLSAEQLLLSTIQCLEHAAELCLPK